MKNPQDPVKVALDLATAIDNLERFVREQKTDGVICSENGLNILKASVTKQTYRLDMITLTDCESHPMPVKPDTLTNLFSSILSL